MLGKLFRFVAFVALALLVVAVFLWLGWAVIAQAVLVVLSIALLVYVVITLRKMLSGGGRAFFKGWAILTLIAVLTEWVIYTYWLGYPLLCAYLLGGPLSALRPPLWHIFGFWLAPYFADALGILLYGAILKVVLWKLDKNAKNSAAA